MIDYELYANGSRCGLETAIGPEAAVRQWHESIGTQITVSGAVYLDSGRTVVYVRRPDGSPIDWIACEVDL